MIIARLISQYSKKINYQNSISQMSTVTFYFRNTPHKVVIFKGMPIIDIEACLFKIFRLPFGTHLIYRDTDGINVPLTSYFPNDYMVHVQLKAAIQDELDRDTIRQLSSWDADLVGDASTGTIIENGSTFMSIGAAWPYYAQSKLGIPNMGDLHVWTLDLTYMRKEYFDLALFYTHIGVSNTPEYHNPRTSLLNNLETICDKDVANNQRILNLKIALDLRIRSNASDQVNLPSQGLYILHGNRCLYHSPLFGMLPTADSPLFLSIWTKNDWKVNIASYQRNPLLSLSEPKKIASSYVI